MLLHEQIPRYLPLRELPARKEAWEGVPPTRRHPEVAVGVWRAAAGRGMPRQAHVLGNGRYSVLITNFGGGSSRWQGRVLVRGEADPALPPRGTWIWVEDLDSGEVWAAAGGPRPPREVRFAPHLAELTSRQADLVTRVTVAVAPDEDLEARLVRIANLSDRPRRLALTSYGEVALAPSAEDRRHPAFSKLFVESGWLPDEGALLFQRRPRSAEEETVVLVHTAVPAPDDPGDDRVGDRPRAVPRAHRPLPPSGGPGLRRGQARSGPMQRRPPSIRSSRCAGASTSGRARRARSLS